MNLLKLFFSVIIDAIGMISILLPIIGIPFDTAWAILSSIIVLFMYPDAKIFGFIQFFEEVMPVEFIDLIPTATIAWIVTEIE